MGVVLALFPTATAQGGVYFYASSPTHANETLLLLGGPAAPMLSSTFVRLCTTSTNCTLIPNVQPTGASAKVVLPADMPLDVFSASSCTTSDPSSCSPHSILVNAPTVSWQQADTSEGVATPGGYIRLFGSALAFTPPPLAQQCVPTLQGGVSGVSAALARLVPISGGNPIPLPLTFASCYALTAPIPPSTPPGDYVLQLSNGLPSSTLAGGTFTANTTLRIDPPSPWPTQVFDVVAMGSVWAALGAAATNGGGVVYFPRGRYAFNENATLNAIPPRTTLQGEGTDLVELYWRDMAHSPKAPHGGSPTSMVQGVAGEFALRNLTLYVQGNFTSPVVSDGGFNGVVVYGVIVRANPYYMMLEPVNQSFHGRSMAIGSGFNSGAAVSVSGCNWAVTDSDLLGGSHAIDIFVQGAPSWFQRPCNGILARNTLVGGFGQYRLEGARGVVVEDNKMRGGGLNAFGSWISTYYAKATSGVYFARNTVESVMGGDRELLSFDGGGGAYLGGVSAVSPDGLTLTLASQPVFAGYIPPGPKLFNYTEAAVCVLEGAGAGQVGRVVRNDWEAPGGTNLSWVLQSPFLVPLDSTSLISIVPFRGDLILTGNTFTDGGAIQLYAMAINVMVSENTAMRTSGFLSWGLNPHNWGVQPNFFTSFVNNSVAVGNAWGGQTGGFATVSASDQGNLTLNRGVVLRGNTCFNNAPIAIGGNSADVVVEGCSVRHNDVGIAVDNATTSGVWLRGNTFEEVGVEVTGMNNYAPGLSSCCNATDPSTGVPIVVKPFLSYTTCGAVGGSCEAHGEPDPW